MASPSLLRVRVTAPQTVSQAFTVDEAPTDAAAAVTVTVRRLDGTLVTTGPAAPGVAGDGVYTFDLPASAELDMWTVDWTGTFGGAAVTVRDFVEHVGGFLFGLDEARNDLPKLDPVKYPTAALARARTEVEQIAERIAGLAFVPRFERVKLSGRGTRALILPRLYIRAIRKVTVDGSTWSTMDTSGIGFTESGVLTRLFGSAWPLGSGNVIVEYEHGLDLPPEDVARMSKVHLRSRLTQSTSAVPYRAVSFSVADGGVYRLSMPSKERTGIPDVDAAYLGAQVQLGAFG